MEAKKFWISRILWANIIGMAAVIVQVKTGFVINPALQGIALYVAVIAALRCITNLLNGRGY
jgi:hypothetical protein